MWFIFLVHCPSSRKEQRTSIKSVSVWEQRANQLRRQNWASCEALYCELDPEERLRLSSALHIRPDMKTHLDRPLIVDSPFLGSCYQHHQKPNMPDEAETDADLPVTTMVHQPRRHHRHRDRDRARTRKDIHDNGDGSKDGRHVHHNRYKERNGSHSKEGKSERSHSRETGRRRHHQSSVDDIGDGGVMGEREHRHHHSHHQSRGGNGTVNGGGREERRSHHKDGWLSNRDQDRSSRGDGGAIGERRRHQPHGSRVQSSAEGEEANERKTLSHRFV